MVNLVFSFGLSSSKCEPIILGYRLQGESKTSVSYLAYEIEDRMWACELFQFTSDSQIVDLEILFEGFNEYYEYIYVQGIEFRPMEKVENEDVNQTISDTDSDENGIQGQVMSKPPILKVYSRRGKKVVNSTLSRYRYAAYGGIPTVVSQSNQSSGVCGDVKSTHTTSRSFSSSNFSSKGESGVKYGGMGSSSSTSLNSRDKGVRTLSRTEWEERRKKGLCYRCGQLYGPTHRCPEGKLRVLLLGKYEDTSDLGEQLMMTVLPSLLLLQDSDPPNGSCQVLEIMPSCNQLSGHQTLQLDGILLGIPICLLVDSGATHNFISQRLVSALALPSTAIEGIKIRLGDGHVVVVTTQCQQLCIQVGPCTFVMNALIFDTGSLDLILGMEWLQSLGPVTHDWKNAWMQFSFHDSRVVLQGSGKENHSKASLQTWLRKESKPQLIVINLAAPMVAVPISHSSSLLPSQQQSLSALLSDFTSIFQTPSSLPPSHSHDHQIILSTSDPIDVRPYCYPHIQKNEIEKQVKELLSVGMIRPSRSAYSSPVTIPDKFPIPMVEELLDELHGAKFFTKLDLKSGKMYLWPNFCGIFGPPFTGQGVSMDPKKIEAVAQWPTPTTIKGLRGKGLSDKNLAKSAYEREMMALVLAVQHWRPYLLGTRFIVCTDQKSLKFLLQQRVTTPDQQNWVAKLLGYNFEIQYKPGKSNKAADALSRRDEMGACFTLNLGPIWVQGSQLIAESKVDPVLQKLGQDCQLFPDKHPGFVMKNDVLFYHNRLVISGKSKFLPALLHEFHTTYTGGHSGYYRTYRRMAANLYLAGMTATAKQYVRECEGFTVILVVVDRLSKYAHFIPLKHPYTAKAVAEVFVKEIVRLHGIPKNILSDCDPLFLSTFWQEEFRAQGTTLSMSSAYHPESDGQTEVVNRCLEAYLRCFAVDQPKMWAHWLPWAEFCPPTVFQYAVGEVKVEAVAQELKDRDLALQSLKEHLGAAQNLMKQNADKKRRELSLPPTSKIHPVIHVSLLKKAVQGQVESILPTDLEIGESDIVQPSQVLAVQKVPQGSELVEEWLIQWQGQLPEEATWEMADFIQEQFPNISLEVKTLKEVLIQVLFWNPLLSLVGIVSDSYCEEELPADYEDIMKWSTDIMQWTTKKEAYSIIRKGFLIDDGEKRFFLDKNRKKCHKLSAAYIRAYSKDDIHLSESRFKEATLLSSSGFSIKCEIESQLLSPQTTYATYLVYKYLPENQSRFEGPMKVRNNLASFDCWYVYLVSPTTPVIRPKAHQNTHNPVHRPKIKCIPQQRNDGWIEVQIWEFRTAATIEMVPIDFYVESGIHIPWAVRPALLLYKKIPIEYYMHSDNNIPSFEGLVIQGFEVRPTYLLFGNQIRIKCKHKNCFHSFQVEIHFKE
ncbi:hypothetical protein E3N88_08446 [Mikania micrantha]|uniref:RNA-directed DNA polymerase n=1 Tax=Mikania micrantha TaxID=192012 RepID=A0A5N6PG81_9ASTR|nr:hypothetical protein E3N88_08446 [Mikania micrantha]